ncbi:riboflavin kinase [Patescibacteria group bacterium]
MQKLVKPVKLTSQVIKGNGQGLLIGFPTANLKLSKTFPKIKKGVYFSVIEIHNQSFLGLTYYGPKHINNQATNVCEVHIFNFDKNIYSQTLKLKLTHFIRPPKKPVNLQAVKKLIQQDIRALDNYIVLVSKQDQPIGIEKILKIHQNPPQLHQAISVLIYNSKKQLLLQKRSKYKPLWSLYWSNTCCSNVRPGLSIKNFAKKRLNEEMGLTTKLKFKYKLPYKAKYNHRLSEYEIDHVFFGFTDDKPIPNPKEAADFKYISIDNLKKDIKTNPSKYTPWFKLILKRLETSDILSS